MIGVYGSSRKLLAGPGLEIHGGLGSLLIRLTSVVRKFDSISFEHVEAKQICFQVQSAIDSALDAKRRYE